MNLTFTRLFLHFVVIFASASAFAQLSDFTLIVSSTNETCTGNGSLTFTVSGTASGAAVVYNIYELPNTSVPIATTAQNSFSGLTSGTYQVTATQTLSGLSNSQTQTVTIEDQVSNLTYELNGNPEVCGEDGVITVTAITGSPAFYEIMSGPLTFPQQVEDSFTGLVAGVYVIRVTDVCGDAVVQTFTLLKGTAGINLGILPAAVSDCDSLEVSLTITPAPNAAAAYPMTITCTVFPPSGEPIVFTQVVEEPDSGEIFTYTETVPNYDGETFSYEITVTDNCGNIYVSTNVIGATQSEPGYSILAGECSGTALMIFNITGLVIESAPNAYTGTVPFDFTAEIGEDHLYEFGLVPPGTYLFTVVDLCGNESELEIIISPPSPNVPGISSFAGCEEGFGSVMVSGNLVSVIMTAAPQGFSQALPLDVSSNIASNGSLVMNQLPMGTYSFQTTNTCGAQFNVTGSIQGYAQETNIGLIPHCGSFDLELLHSATGGLSQEFWLQKYNSATGQWGHPATGVPYIENTQANPANSISLSPNAITYNLAFSGSFRILKIFQTLANGTFSFVYCYNTVYEFDYEDGPQILDVYSFSCNNSVSDVVVVAEGVPPLNYSITHFNGSPFNVNNATSNVFTAIPMGLYNFQVEDSCGNIVNSLFEINSTLELEITSTPVCEGQQSTLSVPYFDFLDYEWWNGSDAGNILSTTGSLEFDQFNPATDNGTYFVRIRNPDPLSCIDITLSINLTGIASAQAGTGMQTNFCDRPQVDLFSLLQAPFDSGGNWSESTPIGILTGSIADFSSVEPGTYQFIYAVANTCGSDSAVVTITLNPAPSQIIATAENGNCNGTTISLFANGSATSYFWTGPNGFSSTDQNPVIENATPEYSGVFTVVSSVGECLSDPASVMISIGQAPLFELSAVCENDIRYLTATPIQGSEIQDAGYSWSGPNGFSSASNPAIISGNAPGEYSLTITTVEGCSVSQTIPVGNTQCAIPLGISPNGDGLNDGLDLTGFDVENLQIFNRYGVTVYEAPNYKDQWVGQDFKGRILPAGAYYFLVRLNSGETESGWVYLNREH